MNKSLSISLILLTILTVSFWFYQTSNRDPKILADTPQNNDTTENTHPLTTNPKTSPNSHIQANNKTKDLNSEESQQNDLMLDGLESFDAPSIETYQEELKLNPHTTPTSLIQFAYELTPHIERALKVSSYADEIMKFLENCALGTGPNGNQTPDSAKASCLVNASRLAQAHPTNLKSRFEYLKNGVSQHVLQLSRKVGLKE